MEKEEPPSPQEPALEDDAGGRSLIDKVRTMFGLRGGPDTTEQLEQEIQELLEEGEEQGLISVHEEKLITSIFNFRETRTSEIMTPSAEIVAAERNTPIAELIRLITEEGYTRIPVYKDTLDHILGVLHAKDLLRVCGCTGEGPKDIEALIKPLPLIPESKPITELLREFQTNKNHMAIVTDEFGGVRGLITLEDVIEEIVGEIEDEFDDDEEEGDIYSLADGSFRVSGDTPIERINEHFEVEIHPSDTEDEDSFETIGGLIAHEMGHVPTRNEFITLAGLNFVVMLTKGGAVRWFKVTPAAQAAS